MTPIAREIDLRDEAVHVWSAELDAPQWPVAALEQTLSADELRRAARYHFAVDRRRFVVRRALLRLLLSRYTRTEPTDLEFRYGPAGKPELAQSPGDAALRFSLSHTHGLALFAIAWGRRIGVDVEALRPLPDFEAVARICLTAREHARLRALPAGRQCEAFFLAWTRKEAFVKATGEGLALPPERIEVTIDPGEPAILYAVGGAPDAAAAWTLRTLPIGRTHAGTVAVEGRVGRLVSRRLEPWSRAGRIARASPHRTTASRRSYATHTRRSASRGSPE